MEEVITYVVFNCKRHVYTETDDYEWIAMLEER